MKRKTMSLFASIFLLFPITACTMNEFNIKSFLGLSGPQGEQGLPGEDGVDGKDGTNGENGNNGLSAYDIYIQNHPEYDGDETQWLNDLINGRLGAQETHVVTFDSNGGTPVESQTVLHGEKAIRPENPTKIGYVFVDWVDENNDHWVFNGFSVTNNITLTAVWSETYAYSKIKINEICSKNRKSFLDKYGENSDWIELYNSSNTSVNLNGCGLSNNDEKPYLLSFGDTIIDPDDYIVIALSGRENSFYNGEYHAPFTLSQKKEGTITFSAPYGMVDSVTYPALKDDISYGRLGDELTMLKPSPGKNNEEVYIEKQILPAPVFSKASGIYDDEFDLTLSSNEGYHIYYTVDSGKPSENSLSYSEPIHIYDKSNDENVLSARKDVSGTTNVWTPSTPVQKCFVVRAICYDDAGNYSNVVSSSYWIGQDNFIQNGIAVLSLSTDFDNLFSNDKGIYCNGDIWNEWYNSDEFDPELPPYKQPANYTQKGFDWEREANITFLNEKHNLKCEQSVGMRIKGGATRSNVKKSINLYSRFLYDGKSKFDYKFNGRKCESISLRSGGNDYNLLVTDPINSMIAKKASLNFTTQENTPTYLYLNGEFWGLYFINDKYDSKFIEEEFEIEDSIIWKENEIEEGYFTDIEYFNEAEHKINNNLLTPEGYSEFEESFCVSSLVDAIVFQSYIDNTDFHLFGSNSAFWRSRKQTEDAYSDGLFRYMLFDTDFSLGSVNEYQDYPKLIEKLKNSNDYKYLFLSQEFVALIKNRANQIVPVISNNDYLELALDYYNKLYSLIELDALRFGHTVSKIQNRWDTVYEFLQNRANYFLEYINEL